MSLTISPMVPLAVETVRSVRGGTFFFQTEQVLNLNQRPCPEAETGCPYGTDVTRIANELGVTPPIIENMVTPTIVRIQQERP